MSHSRHISEADIRRLRDELTEFHKPGEPLPSNRHAERLLEQLIRMLNRERRS